jgi:histidinol phosphatase-like PHP family hydrolase
VVDTVDREDSVKRIDTHTHPKISKHFAFNPRSVARTVRMAKRVGLDGVALTEHFHATG